MSRKEYECPFCGRIAWMEIGPAKRIDDAGAWMAVSCDVIECTCGATRAWFPEEYVNEEDDEDADEEDV